MTHEATFRVAGIGLATTLHLAIGWALWSLAVWGPPARSQTDVGLGRIINVRLMPANPAPLLPADNVRAAGPPPTSGARAFRMKVALGGSGQAAKSGAEETNQAVAQEGAAHPDSTRSMDQLPNAEVLAYRALLETHLARYRTYPASARAAGSQGVVVLHFVSDRDGRVIEAWVETSSGVSAIDEEALRAVARAQPLPPFPGGWPDKVDISLPLIFKLG